VKRLIAALTATIVLNASPVFAGQSNGSAQLKYKILPTVKAQVIPNYQAGFGIDKATSGLGSGQPPATGPNASLQGGTVDFGNVVVGFNYLYRFAAQVNVQTNDTSGFVVYGEGATDLNGSNPIPSPSSFPIFQTLFWLNASSTNSAFSPATSFNKTLGSPIAGGLGGIDYSGTGGTPSSQSVVWSSASAGSLSQGYDYELRVPGSLPTSQFNVYIVYTVIGN
jgi:hypothetical protein